MRSTIARNLTSAPPSLLSRERRGKERIQVRIPLRITYQSLRDEVSEDGTCTDISEAGIAFETQADLYVGEFVDLEFRRQDVGVVRFSARLLYKIGNRYGAYFTSPGS